MWRHHYVVYRIFADVDFHKLAQSSAVSGGVCATVFQ